MGDPSGSAEMRTSSKSKELSARPRSSEGVSEQNSEDKNLVYCRMVKLI